MKTIEISPENRMIGRREPSDWAMPGQLRIPKDVAISKHIAQFWNPQNHGEVDRPPTYTKREIAARKKQEEEEAATNMIVQTITHELKPGDSIIAIVKEGKVTGWEIARKKNKRVKKKNRSLDVGVPHALNDHHNDI
jgi:hypothetical protein